MITCWQSLRVGKKECPSCRTACPSMRQLVRCFKLPLMCCPKQPKHAVRFYIYSTDGRKLIADRSNIESAFRSRFALNFELRLKSHPSPSTRRARASMHACTRTPTRACVCVCANEITRIRALLWPLTPRPWEPRRRTCAHAARGALRQKPDRNFDAIIAKMYNAVSVSPGPA
jgi:hypothetical protein